jgi:hypothetical protein
MRRPPTSGRVDPERTSGVVVVATDIAVNKYLLKLSPIQPEFRGGMLYAVNPDGFGSMIVSAGVSIAVFFGAFGPAIQPFSPLVAIGLALVLPPILAVATKGRYYLRRTDDGMTCRCTTSTAAPPASCRTATSAGRTWNARTWRSARRTTRWSARCAEHRPGG